VDVGAYCGEITVEIAMRVGPTGQVYALEPDPANRVLIQKNLDLQGLTNVTVLPYGLWSETTNLAFAATGGSGSSFQCVRDHNDIGVKPMEITTLSPSDLLNRIGRVPDFIKMDIEGAEVEVIRTLAPRLAKRPNPLEWLLRVITFWTDDLLTRS
jgi:FkbM family methyltransferase